MTPAPAPLADPARRALTRFNAAAGMLLLVAGGMVTSTNSGLAVPDWPLSYGQWLPKMAGGVFFEHGHRMIAAAVGFLILATAVWTQLEETRPAVRRLAWWTLGLVILQGVMGGITVYFGLPVLVSSAHAVLGQSLFCLLVVMAEVTNSVSAPSVAARNGAETVGRTKWIGVFAVAALWGQLVMGAIMRHGGSGIVWHLLGAAVAAPAAGWLGAAALARREPGLNGPAGALLGLLAAQLTLGLATADFRSMPSPRTNHVMISVATIHLAVGALLLGTAVLLTFRLFRLENEPAV
jgi:cytochrome c oxidase assembly protein subunit 15